MNQRGAFKATIDLMDERLEGVGRFAVASELSPRHLHDMYNRLVNEMPDASEAKIGRWLGWAQASVVSMGLATLEDMKQINKSFADEQ